MMPQRPQENSTAVTTSAEGHGAATGAPSAQSGAAPDVRLLPDGRVAWHLPHPEVPVGDLEWLTTDEKGRPTWYAERELPADSQRLIPVGPLLDLADLWGRKAESVLDGVPDAWNADHRNVAQLLQQRGGDFAKREGELRALLTFLLGTPESPARREGDR